eukprot:TRINITY_DN22956_c0_g1_i1.p1 TRINITY_DN22956_c0_g1~~TRINITY_DN22956_c0_g1_i1.p1  ORF type:complete len:374 (+),score=59.59 TRINITY_DN22956_c0_g1_i1:364-1485(+)
MACSLLHSGLATELTSQCLSSSLQSQRCCPSSCLRKLNPLRSRHLSFANSHEDSPLYMSQFPFLTSANLKKTQRLFAVSSDRPVTPKGGSTFPATSSAATSSPAVSSAASSIVSEAAELVTPLMQSLSWNADATSAEFPLPEEDDPVVQIHTIEEYENALKAAGNKLVVVEYAASHSKNSARIYPVMVKLSRTISDVIFLLVMGDESDETKELCRRANVTSVPHFRFYKQGVVVHEEQGVLPDVLSEDVLYYGENHSPVLQIVDKAEVDALIKEHKDDGKLLVVDIGLKHCGPCVKVYPTVIKLAHTFAEVATFVRVFGDENSSCKQLMREYEVKAVPTFLFFRGGALIGRFVGSGRGELIGEMLRYQGVQCT